MANMPKPQKSKAPAAVQPAGGYHSQAASHDPCCIPVSTPSNTSWSGKDGSGGHPATHHIMNPTAH